MKVTVNPRVSEWILKQPWLPQFINNCIAANNSPAIILFYLLGSEASSMINGAFLWMGTPEGHNFWNKIDQEKIDVGKKEHWNDFDTTIEI